MPSHASLHKMRYPKSMSAYKIALGMLSTILFTGCGLVSHENWHPVPTEVAGPKGVGATVSVRPYPMTLTKSSVRVQVTGTATLGKITQWQWGMLDMAMPHCETGSVRKIGRGAYLATPSFCMAGTWQFVATWQDAKGSPIEVRALIPVQ
ncbi:MAG: hypothetical protein C7B46_03475 [Sulfobacillus benefaciens]|uniref:YtkA-like domain-containing protein n=1 Tax=Sulfobacillus benefaciens TaxID=453960 RepID=A0A2T2XJW8_9FIRM|nr:MAG: hypothetical protein C7B46_03475 [Sulfobacillus benefaciens]